MGAPGASTMAQIAKQRFASFATILPIAFPLDMGHPHFSRSFIVAERSLSISPLGPSSAGFLALSGNVRHVAAQKKISQIYYDYIDGICKAISCAWADWCKAATLSNVLVSSSIASGGMVSGPKLSPIITLRGPHGTLMLSSYTTSIADAIGEAWRQWELSIQVPGLMWYPNFVAWPGPMAAPKENVPSMLTQLGQNVQPLGADALKQSIITKLLPKVTIGALVGIASGGGTFGSLFKGPIAPHHDKLADAISYAFDQCFQKWRAQTQVTKVWASGPVPSFAPPAVPSGPVVNGTGNMLPGGFDTAVFDPGPMARQITQHEGFVPNVYPDPVHGWSVPTVGTGFNLNESWIRNAMTNLGIDPAAVQAGTRAITAAENAAILEVGITQAANDAASLVDNFATLPAEKQGVLVDMAYNLGKPRLSGFTNMIAAVEANDFDRAADEMVNSNWYNQTGDRAKALTKTMREDPCK
jgi:lysozyme